VPKGISSNDSYLVNPEQDEIVQQERTLQKVPSSSSPISRNQLWSSITPGIYSDSPNKTWIQEDYSLSRASRRPWSPGASDTGISKEVNLEYSITSNPPPQKKNKKQKTKTKTKILLAVFILKK
jgi:hypothetical protein